MAALARRFEEVLDRLATQCALLPPGRSAAAMPERPTVRDTATPLVPLRLAGALPPLFCVHPASGNGTVFAHLATAIPGARPVWALHARGQEPGEQPHGSIAEMAEDYIDAIREVQANGPYHLLGWSFGGSVVHEMAVQLEGRGETVALLVILDQQARHAPWPEREGPDIAGVLADMMQEFGEDPARLPQTPDARLLFARDLMAQHGLVPAATPLDWVERTLRQIPMTRRLLSNHEPRISRAPIVLVKALVEPLPAQTEDLGWSGHTMGGVTRLGLAVRHNQMVDPGPSKELSELLAQYLA
jgi:nonribosomal peptide synthetase DhbF